MNMMNKGPLGQKQPKAKKNPRYLQKVRRLPCCICEAFGLPQITPTEAHHVICGRFGTRKTPDTQSIPLCNGCHSGDFDTTKIAIHRNRELWVRKYGPDTDYVAATQDKLEAYL